MAATMHTCLFIALLSAFPFVSYTACCGSCTNNCTDACSNTGVPPDAFDSGKPYAICTDCLAPSKINDTVHQLYEKVLHPASVTLDTHGYLYLLDRNRSAHHQKTMYSTTRDFHTTT